MGELERNMRDDVGQSQGNAPSTDSRRQMDMFEDERQRVSHRRGAIARGVAKRGLVAFLAFAMAFGTTPAQLWAEGAEGIAEAVAQAAPPAENGSGESTTSPAADLNASGVVANGALPSKMPPRQLRALPTRLRTIALPAMRRRLHRRPMPRSRTPPSSLPLERPRLSLPRPQAKRSRPRAPSSAPTPRAPSRPGPPPSRSR